MSIPGDEIEVVVKVNLLPDFQQIDFHFCKFVNLDTETDDTE